VRIPYYLTALPLTAQSLQHLIESWGRRRVSTLSCNISCLELISYLQSLLTGALMEAGCSIIVNHPRFPIVTGKVSCPFLGRLDLSAISLWLQPKPPRVNSQHAIKEAGTRSSRSLCSTSSRSLSSGVLHRKP